MGFTSDFNANVAYSPADVNAIRQSISTAGVIPETATSMKVVAIGGGKVRISEGQALFDNGARIAIDSEGVDLTVIGTGKNYVYVKREQNSSEPYITTTAPTGDYVLLAEVTGQTVTDKREYSAFKVTRGLGNGYFVKKNEDKVEIVAGSLPGFGGLAKITEIEVDSAEYNFIALDDMNLTPYNNSMLFHEFQISNELEFSFGSGRKCKIIYSGTTLEFWLANSSSVTTGITWTFNLYLM